MGPEGHLVPGVTEGVGASTDVVLPTPSASSSSLPRTTMGRFDNVPINDLFLIEICAGTARLGKAAARLGFRTMPIDCSKARAKGIHIFVFDLCCEDQVRDLFNVLDAYANRIALIFCAPPCGTASRARERPIPGVANPPAPLRSTDWPDGLPGLDYANKLKTELANQIYAAIAEVTKWAAKHDIEIVVENPLRSHMWETSFFAPASDHLPEHIVFQACMHGGGRDKFTLLRASSDMLQPLAVLCDGSHRHLPWQPKAMDGKLKFPTHEEAAYPHLLCDRIAGCLLQWFVAQGEHMVHSLPQQVQAASPETSRLVLNALPRSAKVRPMVGEHGRFLALHGFTQPQTLSFMAALPKGSRILSRHPMGEREAGDMIDSLKKTYSPLVSVSVTQQRMALQLCGASEQDGSRQDGLESTVFNVAWLQLHHNVAAVEKPGTCPNKAESFAAEVLNKGWADQRDMMELINMLPCEGGARASGWATSEKSWTTGAYVHGGVVARRKNCRLFKNVTILMGAILRAAHPGMDFSSAALFLDTKTKPHKDTNNLKGCPNLVVPLSSFTRGQICVRDDHIASEVGSSELGAEMLIDVASGPCSFDSSICHHTMEWEGNRLVLVGFHIRDHHKLSTEDMFFLKEVEYPVKDASLQSRAEEPRVQPREVCVIGVPSSPYEFVARAVAAGHPRDLKRHTSELTQAAINASFILPPYEVAKHRVATIKRWTSRAAELDPLEKQANLKRPPHLRPLLCNKRLMLMREILTELEYPDVAVVRDIERGFPLSGWMPDTGVFEARTRQPSFSLDTLKVMAKGFEAAVRKRLNSRQDPSLEQATWEETREELAKAWLWKEDNKLMGQRVFAMRFGLQHKDKVRVIDDCSIGGLNGTVGLPEKLRVHSIDILLNMVVCAFKSHEGSSFPECVGRTFDLKSAYRQFGIDEESRRLLRIIVNNAETGEPVTLGVNTLPFGAVGSVAGFLRISVAVWFIGLAALKICWTAFYDDFTTFCRTQLTRNTEWAIISLFRLLGLDFATEGPKAPDFSSVFKSLGLQVDLSEAANRVARVGHTAERREDLTRTIKDHLDKGELSARQAEQLRGRMVFFEGFAFGRTTNQALKQVSLRAECGSDQCKLDATLQRALEIILLRVSVAKPLEITAQATDTFYIFTDGAFEGQSGSIGGVLFDQLGNPLEFFAAVLSEESMTPFLAQSRNPIYELELLPIAVAFYLWAKRLRHKQLMCYLDNDAARAALIKGRGNTSLADNIVHHAMVYETEHALLSWYARVPTASNPADDPSRLRFEHLVGVGAKRVSIRQELVASLCGEHTGCATGLA